MLLQRLPFFTLCLVAATAAGLAACSPREHTVRIGVAQPLSGELAGDGRSMVNAVRLAPPAN